LYESPLGSGEKYFTIYAVEYQSNIASTLIQIEGCEGTIIFVDDKVVLPQIFDIKYEINNSTIRSNDSEYHYVNESVAMPVSAIVDSPIIPLNRAELRIITIGESAANAIIIPMNITKLKLPLDENGTISVVSGIIPVEVVQAPAVEFWIYLVTAEGLVKESVHNILSVRPDGYTGESSVEMDSTAIKAQGTTLRPTAYVTNTETPVYGVVSLIVDGKKVYLQPTLLEPGQNIVNLKWMIPKTDSTTSYSIQAQLELYEDTVITSKATVNTYVRTQKMPIDGIIESISYATDQTGNAIARPALLYASNEIEGMRFKVTAPDGTCVIGADNYCLIQDSTTSNRGAIDSVLLDGKMYRIKYSGADNALERFSITSLDSVAGDWKVELESEYSIVPYASAEKETMLTVKFRAEQGSLVKVKGLSEENTQQQFKINLFDGTLISQKYY